MQYEMMECNAIGCDVRKLRCTIEVIIINLIADNVCCNIIILCCYA